MRALATVGCVLLVLAELATAQRAQSSNQRALPPVSLTCVHHPDVIESRPGSCPFCKMALVPVRLDSAWMCPIHSTITDERPGACPLCRRQLIRVTMSLTWTCRAQSSTGQLEPGTCPDGTPMVLRRTLRPHGNHNPQHGGQFFMAPDNWHHLEGTYPRDRVFRLYLYDDYARPLTPDRLKNVRARVVTKETFDPATRRTTELSAFPLRVVRNLGYLEARVDRASIPIDLTAKVQFDANAPEYRFDFTFPAIMQEPMPATRESETQRSSVGARGATSDTPASRDEAGSLTARPERDVRVEPQASAAVQLLNPLAQPIPDSVAGIVQQLSAGNQEIAGLIARGDFALVWVPAFQAKDLALALAPHLEQLTRSKREVGEPALQELVRTAWLLDAYADVGNRPQIEAAYAAFASAVKELASAFGDSQ